MEAYCRGYSAYSLHECREVADKVMYDLLRGFDPRKVSNNIAEDRAEIERKAKENGTWMKAPNGRKSKLTEEQWVTVRTRQFKDWFGDWENDPEEASKVLDENGEPMVVYHGTKYSGFSVFNKNPMQHGYYFSDEDTASWYTGEGAEVVENIEEADGDGIYAVMLNMRKPLVLDYKGYGALDYENTGLEAPDYYMQHLPAQYDGVICENIQDYGGFNGGYVEKDDNDIPIMPAEGKVYAVKNNTQIKSVTGNVGTFDEANPDIRYQKAGSGSKRDSEGLKGQFVKPHKKSMALDNEYHGFTQKEYDDFSYSYIGKQIKESKIIAQLESTM